MDLRYVYVPAGHLEPAQVLCIHERFKQQRLLPWISWYEQELEESRRGSSRAFLRLWDASDAVIVASQEHFVGVVWFNRHTPVRSHLSFCFCRKLATDYLIRATHGAILQAQQHLGFEELWGETPWPWVVRASQRAGAQLMATLPGFVSALGKRRPLYILRFNVKEALLMTGRVYTPGLER